MAISYLSYMRTILYEPWKVKLLTAGEDRWSCLKLLTCYRDFYGQSCFCVLYFTANLLELEAKNNNIAARQEDLAMGLLLAE